MFRGLCCWANHGIGSGDVLSPSFQIRATYIPFSLQVIRIHMEHGFSLHQGEKDVTAEDA